jgi:hypothetical protein
MDLADGDEIVFSKCGGTEAIVAEPPEKAGAGGGMHGGMGGMM